MTALLLAHSGRIDRNPRYERRAPRRARRLMIERLEERTMLATFTVTNTDNSGAGSLRQAILDANATPNVDTSGDAVIDPDVIAFDIAGAGVQTIALTSALPNITDPVVIDGYTQPGSAANANSVEDASGAGQGLTTVLLIELSGAAAGNASGLVITGGGSTVRGLVINRFQVDGIQLRSSGNVVAGNFIGTNPAGDADLGNTSEGVEIINSSGNTIGGESPNARNLISGNNSGGVLVLASVSSATGNRIAGNLIGTDRSGTALVLNGNHGVELLSVSARPVTGNLVGGTSVAARNVITGNLGAGVAIGGSEAAQNLVQGNFLGTDVTGTTILARGNRDGVEISNGKNNTIGGTEPGARNIISGNEQDGVVIAAATGNQILGNFIGTNAAGTAAIGNARSSGGGVRVDASGNRIGGTVPGAGNLISGNEGYGVQIRNATNNRLQGNRIGTDLTGSNALPNTQNGVNVTSNANDNLIGGTDADDGLLDGLIAAGNIIAFNRLRGVAISSGTGNRILGNSIFANVQLGIDMGGGSTAGDGVTPNDADNPATSTPDPDSDDGPNNRQNFPVLTTVSSTPTVTTIEGTLTSTPDRDFRIELFANMPQNGCHSGEAFVGFRDVRTGPDGLTDIFTFTANGDFRDRLFTATATELTSGDTSEFSRAFPCPSLIVNTTSDVVDPTDGLTSLREAISSAGSAALFPGPDAITFSIPASDPGHLYYRDDGQDDQVTQALIATTTESDDANIVGIDPDWPHSWWSIRPNSALPSLSSDLTIDGYTQPGSSANTFLQGTNAVLRIELDGSNAGANSGGLFVNSATATIQALVINRFGRNGILLRTSNNNVLSGNFIGTDPSGTLALGNGDSGVLIQAGLSTTVGGSTPHARNLISGNSQSGIAILSDTLGFNPLTNNHQIVGNLIGTERDGSSPLGNGLSGVSLRSGSRTRPVNDNVIERNVIAFNGEDGVLLATGGIGTEGEVLRNRILSNSIFANARLGINIGGNPGVNSNDLGDGDAGPNNLQNFPVIEDVAPRAFGSTILGVLNSQPQTKFLIQLFANDAADPSGFGEGQTLVGETVVQTDSAGSVSFTADVPAVFTSAQQVTATATRLLDHDSDPNTPLVPTDTSEFSRATSGVTSILELGQTVASDLPLNAEFRFRLSVPPGTDARLTAHFTNPRIGEILVRVGNAPDANNFIERAVAPVNPDPEFLLAGQPVPYFITVRGTSPSRVALGQFSLSAQALGLEIDRIAPNRGSNAGQVTSTLVGSGFSTETVFSLIGHGIERLAATAVQQSDTTFFVTFDLAGLTTGSYDVRAVDGASSTVLASAFTVTAGNPGQLEARLVTPAGILRNRQSRLIVEYANIGETDLPAPLLLVVSDNSVLAVQSPLTSLQPHATGGGNTFLVPGALPSPPATPVEPVAQFLAISRIGPAGLLPPGAREKIEIRFQDDGRQSPGFHSALQFRLIEAGSPEVAFDLASGKEKLRPSTVSPEAWDIIFSNLLARVGPTVGDYVQALRDSASYLSRYGVYSGDVDQLLTIHFSQADNALPGTSLHAVMDAVAAASGVPLVWGRTFAQTISRRFDLGSLGFGWSHPWDLRLSRDSEKGDVLIRTPGGTRLFAEKSEGSFVASLLDPAQLTLDSGIFSLRETNGTVSRFDETAGLLLDVTDRNGHKVALSYSAGKLVSLVHTNGDQFGFDYNAAGRLNELTDQAGRVTTYEYDATGEHLIRVTGPNGVWEYAYHTTAGAPDEHALESVTAPDGTPVFFEYDGQGRLIRTSRDGDAEVLTFAYGTAGEVFVTDALSKTTSFFFNDLGQLLEIRDALERSARFDYDLARRLDRVTQPLDTVSLYDFDANGNLTFLVKPDGRAISVTYDTTLNLPLVIRDERDIPLGYTYDARGNLTRIIRADGSAEQYTPDAVGNIIQSINRRGHAINYTYDGRGLLRRKDHTDGTFEAFTYDDRGNLRTATDETGTTTYVHDLADRLTQVMYPSGRSLEYAYDAGGRRTRLEDQDGFIVNYRYDDAGRMKELTDGSNIRIVHYTYDLVGRLSREDHGNGTFATYEFDDIGQLTSLVNHLPDGAVSSRFDYTYDSLGRRTSVTTLQGLTTFDYDAIGQLSLVILPDGRTIQYQYDAAGNRTAVIDNGVMTTYDVNSLNQYLRVGLFDRTYDVDGNLIRDQAAGPGGTIYTYDDENRLLSSVNGLLTVGYEYDVFGDRTAKVEGGVRTEYLVDPLGTSVVAEYDSAGNVMARYVHGRFGLVSRQDAGGIAAFYDFDAVGSTVRMTEGAGVNHYSYLPFGEAIAITEAIVNPFEFVGQVGVQRDGNGLDFMQARYYSAADGRFLNEDPIGVLGGLNLYTYVANRPTDQIDPTGLCAFCAPTIRTAVGVTRAGTVITAGERGAGNTAVRLLLEGFELEAVQGSKAAGHLTPEGREAVRTLIGEEVAVFGSGGALNSSAIGVFLPFLFGDPLPLAVIESNAAFFQLLCDSIGCGIPDFDIPTPPGNGVDDGSTVQRTSFDPNDIIGPAGFGPDGFVQADSLFVYTIRFENLAAATAAAQSVIVIQSLDPDLDTATFEFLNFGFGGGVVDLPTGRSSFSRRFDLRPDQNLLLDVAGDFNFETGLITWTFTSLEPATLALPDLDGFLPPNQNPPHGEGFVAYVVRPKPGLPTGTRIDAQARIIFDVNEPIDTPAIFNTIDAGAPSSNVATLPAVTNSSSLRVSWSGTDDAAGPSGSGIHSFDVFVSDNGGPFQLLLDDTTDTSLAFTGEDGHMYGFFSVATDNVGHKQPVPAAAHATVQFDRTAPILFNVPPSQVLNATSPAGARAGFVPPTASDTIDPSPDVTCVPSSDSVFPIGITTVSCAARDDAGNANTADFTITVEGVNGPQVVNVRLPGNGKSIRSVIISFDKELNRIEAERLDNYQILAPGKDKLFGTNDDKRMALRSAVYDATANEVTLSPVKRLKVNRAFQITIQDSLTDAAGRPLDGDSDGIPGGDRIVRGGRWSHIAYADDDGDKVRIRLVRRAALKDPDDDRFDADDAAGWMEVLWGSTIEGRRLLLTNTAPGRSVLMGSVRRVGDGDGVTNIESVFGTSRVENRLANPPFVIRSLLAEAVDTILETDGVGVA